MISKTLRSRFWNKVSIPFDATINDCWEWNAAKNPKGYGIMAVRTRLTKIATHISIYLKTGIWPVLNVLHRCDNSSCVNPHHLFEGTLQENNQDMFNKNRNVKGVDATGCKLTEQDVLNIKADLQNSLLYSREIADKYKISQAMVSNIKHNNSWKHLLN